MFVVEREDFALFLVRSAVLGVLLGAFYLAGGFFRIPLGKGKLKKSAPWVLFVPDLFFCLFAGFLTVLLVFASNRGQVRIMALLFELGGFCLVYGIFKKRVYRLEEILLVFLKNRVLIPLLLPLKRNIRRLIRFIKQQKINKQLIQYNKRLDATLIKTAYDAAQNAHDVLLFRGEAVGTEKNDPQKRKGKSRAKDRLLFKKRER